MNPRRDIKTMHSDGGVITVMMIIAFLAPSVESKLHLVGNGASFPNRLYQQAAFAYKFVNPSVDITYISTGSGGGKCRILNFTKECSASDSASIAPEVVDFVGSDSLLSYPKDYNNYPDVQMYPAVAGAVVPIYHIMGLNSSGPNLVLSPRVLAKIFGADKVERGITSWNDPEIIALNPELHSRGLLPNATIIVVVREDKSGTTEIFTQALSAFDPSFASSIGITSSSSSWSTSFLKADTNGGVAATVLGTPNTIGYSVLAEANVLGLAKASLTVSGGIVDPTSDGVEFALVEKGTLFGNNGQPISTLTADIHATTSPKAWPIAGYTYLIMRKDTTLFSAGQSCESRLETVKFWIWFWTSPVVREMALGLGFAVLPDVVRKIVLAQFLADIKCNGQLVYKLPKVPTIQGVGSSLLSSLFSLFQPAYTATTSDAVLAYSDIYDAASGVNDMQSSISAVLTARLAHADDSTTPRAFAITPASEVSEEVAATNAVLPFAGVAIAVFFSKCGASTSSCAFQNVELSLTVSQLIDLLEGTISSWADPKLRANNPWLTVPATSPASKIQLVGEAEASESMTLLRRMLAAYKPDISFAKTFGAGGSAIVESSMFRVQSRAIEQRLALGISPLVGSVHPLLQLVPLEFTPGDPISPSPSSITACASDTQLPSQQRFDGRFMLRASSDPSCYRFSEAMVIVMRRSFTDDECAFSNGTSPLPILAAEFLQWLNSDTNLEPITNAKMAPLSALQPSFVTKKLNSLVCDGVPILAPSPSPPPPQPAACRPGEILEYGTTHLKCVACPAGKYELDNRLCREAPSSGFVNISAATENDIISCPPNTRNLKLRVEGSAVSMVPVTGAASQSSCVCDVGYYSSAAARANRSALFRNVSRPRNSTVPSRVDCRVCPLGAVCLGGSIAPFAKPGYAMVSKETFAECLGLKVGFCGSHADSSSCDCLGGAVNLSVVDYSVIDQIDSEQINEHVVPFRCGDAYVENTRLCAVCVHDDDRKYGIDAGGKCSECVFPDVFYLFVSAFFVFAWFPAIRYLNIKKMRSMYTTLSFLQFVGFYAYGFNIPWSESFTSFVAVFNSFNLNLNFTHVSCVLGSFQSRWLLQLLMPSVLPIVAMSALVRHQVCNMLMTDQQQARLGLHPFHDFSLKGIMQQFGPPILFYLNMYMYTGVSTTLQIFVCRDASDGASYLESYPPMTCWEGEHAVLIVFGVAGVLFYIVGYIVAYSIILYVKVPHMSESLVGARRAAKLFGFLYLRFNAKDWSFEIYELARKLALAFIAAFGALWSPIVKNFLALLVSWATMIHETSKHPFNVPLYDLYGELTAAVEVIVITIGLCIVSVTSQDQSSQKEVSWLESISMVAIILALCLGVFVSVTDLWMDYRISHAKKVAAAKGLKMSSRLFAVTMNAYLVPDVVELADAQDMASLIECENLLAKKLLEQADDRSVRERNITTRAAYQSDTNPYLLDSLLETWPADEPASPSKACIATTGWRWPFGGREKTHPEGPQAAPYKVGAHVLPTDKVDDETFDSADLHESPSNVRTSWTSGRRTSLKSAFTILNDLTESFHNSDVVRGNMPSIYFFQQTAVGPLIYWLTTAATAEEKQVVRNACKTMQRLKEARRFRWYMMLDRLGVSKLVLARQKRMREAIRASSRGDTLLLTGTEMAAQNMEALAYEGISLPFMNSSRKPRFSVLKTRFSRGSVSKTRTSVSSGEME